MFLCNNRWKSKEGRRQWDSKSLSSCSERLSGARHWGPIAVAIQYIQCQEVGFGHRDSGASHGIIISFGHLGKYSTINSH